MEEVCFARGEGDGERVAPIMLTNLRTKKVSTWKSFLDQCRCGSASQNRKCLVGVLQEAGTVLCEYT